jgi:hypothetical protein
LQGKPPGTARIYYNPADKEAYQFALQISRALKTNGWTVSVFSPLPEVHENPDISASSAIRYSGLTGLVFIGKTGVTTYGLHTPEGALKHAINFALSGTSIGVTDPSLPDDTFVIVVGPKDVPH